MATEQADANAGADASTDADADGGDAADGVDDHVRAVTVTGIASLAGIAAAFASQQLTTGLPPSAAAKAPEPLVVVLAVVALQPALLRAIGFLKEDFGAKDFLYITFLTFSMWFLAWGVLLTSGV